MRLPRFSIASLLVVIGILGVALAALRNPSYLWANVTFSVAFALLIVAIINAIYGSGARRAYWLGFTICGGAYFAVCSMPGLRDSVCLRLASEVVFDLLYPNFSPPVPPPPPTAYRELMAMKSQTFRLAAQAQSGMGSNGGNSVRKRISRTKAVASPPSTMSRLSAWNEPDRAAGDGYQLGNVSFVSSEAFRQIGHSLVTLLVAALGGVYARSRFRSWTASDVTEPRIDQDLA
jgi:hypothetical protein